MNKALAARKQALCIQCQRCCTHLHFYVHASARNNLPRITDFYTARGLTTKLSQESLTVVVPYPCPHLTPDGCAIYSTRPLACRNYDGRKDPILKHLCLWNQLTNDHFGHSPPPLLPDGE